MARSVLDDDVRARPAVEDVLSGAAFEDVVALAAEQGVVPGAAHEDIRTVPSVDGERERVSSEAGG